MRFKTIKEALNERIHHVFELGTKVKAGIWQATDLFQDEIMLVDRNIMFTVPITNCTSCLHKIGADNPWVEEHFQERISGVPTNPGESYKHWPYNDFKPDNDPYMQGKEFSHTYQERIWPKEAGTKEPFMGDDFHTGIRYNYGDLKDVVKLLIKQPLTRQAYLPIWFPEDTGARSKQRVPCTLGYYFYIENNKLSMTYTIRSCDVLRHFRNDMYLTVRLLQHVADYIKVETGELTFIIFNLHLFKNDIYTLTKKERKLENEWFR